MTPQVSIIIVKSRENESTNHCYNSMNIVKNNNRFEFDDEKILIDEICGIHVQVLTCTYENLYKTLLECNTMYTCIVKSNVFVEENFLTEMLFHYENIKNSGIVYLLEDMKGHSITPMPNNDDEFLPVLLSIMSNGFETNIMFFKTLIVHGIYTKDEVFSLESIPNYCAKAGKFIFALTNSFIIKK